MLLIPNFCDSENIGKAVIKYVKLLLFLFNFIALTLD